MRDGCKIKIKLRFCYSDKFVIKKLAESCDGRVIASNSNKFSKQIYIVYIYYSRNVTLNAMRPPRD